MEIYLVFSKTGTWLSNVLRFILRKKYVHVSLSFDRELNNMYSFGRTIPNNPFSGGFVIENIREGVYKKNIDSECIVYKLSVSEEQYSLIIDILKDFKNNKENLKYNLLGLIFAALNIPVKRENYYFCTQFVSELFINANLIDDEKPSELYRPYDLQIKLKELEPIFEGYVLDYIKKYGEK